MHAVVVSVSVAPGQFETAQKALKENVVPRVKQSPGFVKGYWTSNANRTEGWSIAVFNSEQDANNAAAMARQGPMPPGVTQNSLEVREVIADA
jgi:hypothetical protein